MISLKVNKCLPNGWTKTILKEVLIAIRGISFPKEAKRFEYADGLIACLRTANVQSEVDWKNLWFVNEDYINREDQYLEKGDILISISNSLNLLGKVSLIKDLPFKSTLGTFIANLRIQTQLNNKFIFYYLSSIKFKNDVRSNASTTTNISNISVGKLVTLPILISPLPEQLRIVAKIEELFSDLDNGIANLKQAQEQIKVYRQAVLKWAFEGKLTEAWRKEHKPESAEKLLEKIKKERERQYQKQLEEWQKACEIAKQNGEKKPPKAQKIKDLPPLAEAERSELPGLPKGWCWVKLGDIIDQLFDGPFGSNLKTKDYVDSGVRVIRLENIGDKIFINDKKSYISNDKYKLLTKHEVSKGDIIFSSFISDNTRVTILPNFINKAINKADCFCIRSYSLHISNAYIMYYLSTKFAYNKLKHKIHGATRPRINTTQLKNCVISVCAIEEQTQIVQEIETRLSVADKMEQTIEESLQKAEALRQSILKKAFEGRLVPQDPNDEPAEKLVERIRAERETGNNLRIQ